MGQVLTGGAGGAERTAETVAQFVNTLRKLSQNDKRLPTMLLTGLDLTLLDPSYTLPACYEGCLSIASGRLTSPSKVNEQKLLAVAAAAPSENPPKATPFTLSLTGNGGPCLYGSAERFNLDGTPAVLFSFVHPEHHRLPSAERLRIWFDLSPAEAAVALEVAQGHDVDRIAAARELSVLTVRTHLRSIFEKTGAHKQRDLVALLLRLAAL